MMMGALVTTAWSLIGAVPAAASDGLVLRVAFISAAGPEHPGPEGWARKTGLLERELSRVGVSEVRFLGFPNGPDVNEAIAGGAIDLGLYGDTPALIGRAAGLRTRAIYQGQVRQNAWIIAKRPGPRSLADLAGGAVAVSKGSYIHRYLLGLLDETGLAGKVAVVHLLPRDAEAALTRGDIAAYAAPTGVGPLLIERGHPVLDEAAKHPRLLGTGVTVVTEAFAAGHPEVLRAWERARRAALADLRNHPEAFHSFLAAASGVSVGVAAASFPVSGFADEPFPPGGRELLERTKAFLVQRGFARSDFRLDDWLAPVTGR